jgi:excisionase family DNA binding protein
MSMKPLAPGSDLGPPLLKLLEDFVAEQVKRELTARGFGEVVAQPEHARGAKLGRSQLTAAELPPDRLAYRVDEAAKKLGVSRDTIERAIKKGTLKSTKRLGVRLVSAESARALFGHKRPAPETAI